MIDYADFMIAKIQEFVNQDNDLSKIIPFYNNYSNGKKEKNVKKTYIATDNDEDNYPLITVRSMENMARGFDIANGEKITYVSWQIDIICQKISYNKKLINAEQLCNLIGNKIGTFVDKQLKFRRIVATDPVPIDSANDIYSMSLRYDAKHNLLTNIISRR